MKSHKLAKKLYLNVQGLLHPVFPAMKRWMFFSAPIMYSALLAEVTGASLRLSYFV